MFYANSEEHKLETQLAKFFPIINAKGYPAALRNLVFLTVGQKREAPKVYKTIIFSLDDLRTSEKSVKKGTKGILLDSTSCYVVEDSYINSYLKRFHDKEVAEHMVYRIFYTDQGDRPQLVGWDDGAARDRFYKFIREYYEQRPQGIFKHAVFPRRADRSS